MNGGIFNFMRKYVEVGNLKVVNISQAFQNAFDSLFIIYTKQLAKYNAKSDLPTSISEIDVSGHFSPILIAEAIENPLRDRITEGFDRRAGKERLSQIALHLPLRAFSGEDVLKI